MGCSVVFLGTCNSGKTALVRRLVSDTFSTKKDPASGTSFFSHTVVVDKKSVRFHIWDMSGIPKYTFIIPSYVKTADFVVICTDEDDPERVSRYVDMVRKISIDVEILIALTKIDTTDCKGRILEQFATDAMINKTIFRTSAASGEGIRELFTYMAVHFKPDGDVVDLSTEPSSSRCCWY